MPAGAELRGADQLVRTLRDAADTLVENATESGRAAGQMLAQQGSKAAPRRTGHLAESHGYTVVDGLLSVVAATPYASIVHARNPWLTRTVVAEEDQVVDIYLAGVDDALAHVRGI